MQDSQGTRSSSRWIAGLLGLKTALVVILLAGLVATNVASLLSASFHDMLYMGVRKALLIGGEAFADRATRRSVKRANEEAVGKATKALSDEKQLLEAKGKQLKADYDKLETRHAKTSTELEGLQSEHKKVKTAFNELETATARGKKTAKELAGSVNKRLGKGVARNTSAIPAEALPYIGIGVTLSLTALDIYDACVTMKEVNDLMRMLGLGEEHPDYCGKKLPTTKQVVESLKSEWQTSLAAAREEVKGVPAGISIPEVRLPTAAEAKSVICPIYVGLTWLKC